MQYKWDPKRQRYIDVESGRFVAWPRVKKAQEQSISFSRKNVERLSKALVQGKIDVAAWREAMAAEMKSMHLASAMIARGGKAQMTTADWGRVGQRLRMQYQYLDNFAAQIVSGAQPADGRLVARAMQYSQATRGTYEAQRRANANEAGYTQERRRLHSLEHCDGCEMYASLGWQPLGTLPGIGEAECRANCRCTFEFK